MIPKTVLNYNEEPNIRIGKVLDFASFKVIRVYISCKKKLIENKDLVYGLK